MASLQNPLHIDISVKLAEIKVALSVAALAFERITKDIPDSKAKGQVPCGLSTNAGHLTIGPES